MRLSFLDAAYEVLKSEGKPMSGEEITQKALERDLIETRGKTPWASIRAQLYVNIRDRGLNSKFVKVGRNLFGLGKWGGKSGLSIQTHRKKALTTKTYNTSDEKLLAVFKDEIRAIRNFIKGSGGANPSPYKSYFWIWFCSNVWLRNIFSSSRYYLSR